MLLLVHSAPTTLNKYRHPNLGVLSSPRRFYLDVEGWQWAADNDAYSAWDETRYRTMLTAVAKLPGCLFITLPDVVGDGDATLELHATWVDEVAATGKPVALVGQDGMTPEMIPWKTINAIFIGGTTQWKMGPGALAIARETKRRGLWLHMGRVNGHVRIRYANAIGCDSIDGTSASWFKDVYLAEFLNHVSGPPQLMIE